MSKKVSDARYFAELVMNYEDKLAQLQITNRQLSEIVAKQKKELQVCVTRPGSGLWSTLTSIDGHLKDVFDAEDLDDARECVNMARDELIKLLNMLSAQ